MEHVGITQNKRGAVRGWYEDRIGLWKMTYASVGESLRQHGLGRGSMTCHGDSSWIRGLGRSSMARNSEIDAID